MLFWFSIAGVIVFLSLAAHMLSSYFEMKKIQRRLKENWGTLNHAQQRKVDSLENLKASFILRKNYTSYDFSIDDETWNNLNLDEIFSQINNTQTSVGSEFLYSKMRLLHFSKDNQFEKIKEYLSENKEVKEKIQETLARLGKKDNNQVFQIVFHSGLEGIKYDRLYIILGLLPVLSLFLALVNNILGSLIFICSVCFNLIFYVFRKYSLELELERMSYLVQIIHVSKSIAKIDFPDAGSLSENLKNFTFINFLGYAFNYKVGVSETLLIFEYINAIFMIPFIAYSQLNSKLFKHNQSIKEILNIISSLDAAIANLNYLDYSAYSCVPSFHKEFGLIAEEVYHPLLKNPVSNSIEISRNILISGDNASGKSTFMRTIAINCILSQSLNFALAKKFSMLHGGISTSMNIGDNVLDGESHFVAEGKRIRELIQKLSSGTFNYLFLDEVFNGTNSTERVAIGASLMVWLGTKNCSYMITTHDTGLVKAGIEYNENYYFVSATATNKSDYKIREGISVTTNAISTLENLGYPEDLVRKSKENLQKY